MQIRPLQLDKGVNVEVLFSTTALPSANQFNVLVVTVRGRTGIGSGSNLDATYIEAMTRAALTMTRPAGLVFDFREFEYEWGDMLSATIAAGDRQYIDAAFPTAAVVSAKCRKGLTSLVQQEMRADPATWLFDDLGSAVEAVDRQRQKLFERN